jgi:peptidoglycan/LPS O-acetylase OafA/YrhL
MLSRPVALFAGRISYAFYMVHMLVLGAFANGLTNVGVSVIFAGSLLVTVVLAAAIYLWIEEPARAAITRRIDGDARAALPLRRTATD